ncbi:MAG TPA: hypothetical protein VFM53_16400 [Anaeromyxobacteraceae bacterium]|nr:hypothetical protein [Anaeromyxobacteraceae bacterium]
MLFPAPAAAYEERVHQLIGERALPATLPRDLGPATAADVDELRIATWRAGASHPDPAVRARFLARWPTEAGFDAWAWKEFLGLTPEARVVGLDVLPAPEPDARTVAALASRRPDDDRRNVERFAHDAGRRVRTGPDGKPLPRDPAQLDMGALTGLSSQAHAHYGLPDLAFSDSPEVLKEDPRRWAWPPTARAFAADFAQVHSDVALAAATAGTPGGRTLAWIWLGAAHHYVEDVANQIHTLQAVYPFFRDAKIESWKQNVLSLWGWLRPRPGFEEIGLGIIKNHHLFLEDLWGARVFDAAAGRPAPQGAMAGLAALAAGDPEEEAALDALRLDPAGPFARVLTAQVIDASSREGAEVYLVARDLANPRLSRARYEYRAGTADSELRASPDPATMARFLALQSRGFARAASAVRRHVRLFEEELRRAGRSDADRLAVRDVVLRRLVADRVAAADAADARLEAWLARRGASAR